MSRRSEAWEIFWLSVKGFPDSAASKKSALKVPQTCAISSLGFEEGLGDSRKQTVDAVNQKLLGIRF
jgi:hypothetical protein